MRGDIDEPSNTRELDEKSSVVELSDSSIESLARSLRQMLLSGHDVPEAIQSITNADREERRQAVRIFLSCVRSSR